MAQRFAFYPVVVALLFGLSACGVIKDRSNEYLQIEESNELVVPPWYRQDQVNARYPVPEITQKRALPEKFVLPEPPDGTAALGADPYLIETIAGQTWLHLYTSPGKVWPLLDFFWREYNIRPEFENISQGYVATGELDPSSELLSSIFDGAVPSKKLRLQAKLNQGVRRNNAELQVRLVDAALPNASWQALSQYPIEETKILDAMGQFITSEQIENRYSLLANDIGGESLVRINEDEAGLPIIEMQLSFQRAWNELEQAIELAGIVVSDKDRSERVFYVSRLSEDELSSWVPFSNTDSKRQEQNLAIEVSVNDDGVVIVRARALRPGWNSDDAKALLNLIFEHVS